MWCAGSVQSSNEMQSDIIALSSSFFVFFPSGCEVKIYTSFNQEEERKRLFLVHYLTRILGFDLSSWPPVCSFLRRLASESGGLAAGSTGAQGVVRSEMITAVCHCGWQLESHQWEERNGGKRGGSLPSGRWTGSASTVVSSRLQAHSGRNPFSLSFQKCIAQLHTWIIAGCEQCHLSERSSVFRGDARRHTRPVRVQICRNADCRALVNVQAVALQRRGSGWLSSWTERLEPASAWPPWTAAQLTGWQ